MPCRSSSSLSLRDTKKTPPLEKQNQKLKDLLGIEIQFVVLTLIALGARERAREWKKRIERERGREWDLANLLRFKVLADQWVKHESLKGERLEVNENEERSWG